LSLRSTRIVTDAGCGEQSYGPLMKHSMKMMWGCIALLALAVVLSVAGANVGYLLFALPCILMMGAMVWMMMGGSRGGDQK
jgi:hypothetical protein